MKRYANQLTNWLTTYRLADRLTGCRLSSCPDEPRRQTADERWCQSPVCALQIHSLLSVVMWANGREDCDPDEEVEPPPTLASPERLQHRQQRRIVVLAAVVSIIMRTAALTSYINDGAPCQWRISLVCSSDGFKQRRRQLVMSGDGTSTLWSTENNK